VTSGFAALIHSCTGVDDFATHRQQGRRSTMFNRSSHAWRGAFAGFLAVATLLLAHAACAASAHVSSTGGTTRATNNRHTGLLARRCEPPPCPRRAVTVVPKGQGVRP
jgi:hypothetical protein